MKCYTGKRSISQQRLSKLCEYYKFYNNNPQFFMQPACTIIKTYTVRVKMLLYKQIMAKEDS
jgi:hypothetical protein